MKSIEEEWAAVATLMDLDGAPDAVKLHMRRVFFAGVAVMMDANRKIGAMPQGHGVAVLNSISDELNKFTTDLRDGKA